MNSLYYSELQPIELFWAVEKKHMAMNYVHDQTMKNVVKYLREIWYGNAGTFGITNVKNKLPVGCRKLWARCLTIAGTKFVPLYEEISDEVGNLEVHNLLGNKFIELLIDILGVDLIRIGEEDHEFGEFKIL